jgi:predicted nucleic acid-binding protein
VADDSRVFLDTNVLLYLFSEDAARAEHAESVVAGGGTVSVQVLNEFVSTATRKYGLSLNGARETLATVRAICTVVPLDLATHEAGLDLIERYRFSTYDAMIVSAALRAGCTTLYTEDMQAGQKIGNLTIRNPFVAGNRP